MFSLYDSAPIKDAAPDQAADPRDLPFVREALESIDEGGYAEAASRVGYLLVRKGEPLPLARLQLKQELLKDYGKFLPVVSPAQARRIRGKQEIVVRYEPEKAVTTLPLLLAQRGDRERLLKLLEALLSDPRVQGGKATADQRAMLARIRAVLRAKSNPQPRGGAAKSKAAAKNKASTKSKGSAKSKASTKSSASAKSKGSAKSKA